MNKPLNDFKEAYKNYKENAKFTIDAENYLLKSFVFDYQFFVCVKNDQKRGVIIEREQDKGGKFTLNLYSIETEIQKEIFEQNNVIPVNFDYILDVVNKMELDGICINPFSDCFYLTHIQLADLSRQKNFNVVDTPILLHDFSKLKSKEIIKLFDTNIKPNESESVIKAYSDWCNCPKIYEERKQNLFYEFWSELMNYKKFIINVRPLENGKSRQLADIGYEDVCYSKYRDDESQWFYASFLSTFKIQEYFKCTPESNMYISLFTFDDIIYLIDSSHGHIKALKLYDELEFDIPVDDLYEMKEMKERDIFYNGDKGLESFASLYKKDEIMEKLEEDLIRYLSGKDNVKKICLGRAIVYPKDKLMLERYTLGINSEAYDNLLDVKTINDLRLIFNNRVFTIINLDDEENIDKTLNLIWENK